MPILRRGEGGGAQAPSSFKFLPKPGLQGLAKPKIIAEAPQELVLNDDMVQLFQAIHERSPGIMRRSDEPRANYGKLRTRILNIDLALAGGIKLSRACMFYGEKSAGKTTLAMICCAKMQRKFPDMICVWIDIEGTYDEVWAAKLGVDASRMHVVEPAYGEEAVDVADGLLRGSQTAIMVTDSIAFLTPGKEIESSAEDALVGVHARLIGNYIRRINNALLTERHKGHMPIVLHLNQFRLKITSFGDPRTLPGGKALEFSTSQQLLLSNIEHKIQDDKKETKGNAESKPTYNPVILNEHSFIVTKDKTGGRIKEGKFALIRDEQHTGMREGYINQTQSILEWSRRAGMVGERPPYNYGEYGSFKSADVFKAFLFENEEANHAIQESIVAHFCNQWGQPYDIEL